MKIDDPAALRALAIGELPALATQLRDELLGSVAASGGHLASGLGTVELAVALHYVYDTPRDALVWDVGHQAYPHKMLTGRREKLSTIRRRGGISGFLKRDESPHDAFGAGHSSTSISAALGIAVANRRLGITGKAIAIIGDGALTAGLAYEALHHAGGLGEDLVVQRFEPALGPAQGDDVGAGPGEAEGGRLADPPGGAGDESDAAGQRLGGVGGHRGPF